MLGDDPTRRTTSEKSRALLWLLPAFAFALVTKLREVLREMLREIEVLVEAEDATASLGFDTNSPSLLFLGTRRLCGDAPLLGASGDATLIVGTVEGWG